jgi:hypothetical protein
MAWLLLLLPKTVLQDSVTRLTTGSCTTLTGADVTLWAHTEYGEQYHAEEHMLAEPELYAVHMILLSGRPAWSAL